MRILPRRSRDEALLTLLEEAGRNVERAGKLLWEMVSDFPERPELAREILLCEQEGDRITHDIIRLLNSGRARRSLDQQDVHVLATALDDIVDYAEETADSLGLYGIEAPMEQAEELTDVLLRAARAVSRALSALREGRELPTHLVEIHELENEGDRVSREAIATLFTGAIDPMVVIRWKDIFESLEQAIDACETVAHLLEGMELRRGR